jgi:hypothetical protein
MIYVVYLLFLPFFFFPLKLFNEKTHKEEKRSFKKLKNIFFSFTKVSDKF